MTVRSSCRRVAPALAGATLLIGLAGCGGATEESRGPATVPPTTHTTPPATATDPVPLNGRVTDAETYFGVNAHSYGWRSFDPVSEAGLFVTGPVDNYELRRLAVVGRTGRIATLTCRELPCAQSSWLSYPATLGPGADEVTVRAGGRTAQVIGYDGTLHRTLDLGGTTAGGAEVRGLRWSPDGARLAVVTYALSGRTATSMARERIWLVDGVDGEPELAYAVRKRSAVMGSPTWSPDSQSLLLDMYIGRTVGTDVVVLRLQPDGAARPTIAQKLYHSNRHFDWAGNLAWSPDGTRIAVRTRKHITEISAEDGSVLARHPHIEGWLIWPATKGQTS